jgi:hypothetical protein
MPDESHAYEEDWPVLWNAAPENVREQIRNRWKTSPLGLGLRHGSPRETAFWDYKDIADPDFFKDLKLHLVIHVSIRRGDRLRKS